MRDVVLIVTHSRDMHADRVGRILENRGVALFRINLDCFPRDYQISMSLREGGWAGEIFSILTNRAIDLERVGSVWMRKRADFAFSAHLSAQEEAFAQGEANHCLLGWLSSLDSFFMSHPAALRAASWKCEQLVRARRFGFEVPASLICNRPSHARSFIGRADTGAIFKTLSAATLAAEQVSEKDQCAVGLHTTLVRAQDPDVDAVAVLPGLFQQYVEKLYEVRVTVVAGNVFAARIDSQANERTRVDYRFFEADVAYRAIELPPDLAERCCAFVSSYNLAYGAIDLIATPSGGHVFLENNPGGEFVFIEELVPELKISSAVADALIAGRRA